MPIADFAPIEAAFHSVDELVGRLASGDEESCVRRSLEELRTAFTNRDAIEPPAHRLVLSLRMLNLARTHGALRRFRTHSSCSARLLFSVQTELLPALRRVGFEV